MELAALESRCTPDTTVLEVITGAIPEQVGLIPIVPRTSKVIDRPAFAERA